MDSYLLLVTEKGVLSNELIGFFHSEVPIVPAHTEAEARVALTRTWQWCGAVMDLALLEGCGLELTTAFRSVAACAPVLVLSDTPSPEVVNRASACQAFHAMKPASHGNLCAFLEQIRRHDALLRHDLDAIVGRFAEEHGLTRGERRILALSVRGTSRKELAAELGVAENTVKSQTRALLRKCESAEQMGDVVREIWRRAFAP
jgi:DNA-binding NarL/FixJ family response regulator